MINRSTHADTGDSTTDQADAADLDQIRAVKTLPEDTPLVVETGYSMLHLIGAAIAGALLGSLLILLALVAADPGAMLLVGPSEVILA